jgi:hypothetical protein
MAVPETTSKDLVSSLPTGVAAALKLFEKHLTTVDGGLRPMKSARQHARQVATILCAVDKTKFLSSKLRLRQLMDSYVVERKFAPATVKSYLNSLRHWFMYALSENIYEADAHTKNEATKMNATITQWIGTFKKESRRRKLAKQDDDLNALMKPEHWSQFEKSEPALKAVKLLGQMSCTGNNFPPVS